MDNNEKSAKEKFDATMKTVTEKAKTKTGKIVIAVVLVIVLLNSFWSMMESSVNSKMASEVQAVRAEFKKQLAEVDKGSIDLDAVKADAEAMRKAGDSFEAKLNAVIKAEEAKLDMMTKDMENQKAYIEDLKSLLAGETGK